MKKLMICLLAFSLSACADSIVTQIDINYAQFYCKDKMGLAYITSGMHEGWKVACNDGSVIPRAVARSAHIKYVKENRNEI